MLSKGVRYMLLAGILFSTMNVFVKTVSNIPAVEVVFFRSVISFFLSLSVLKMQRVSPFGKNHTFLLLRGLCGAIALVAYFTLLQHVPLASAVTINFLAPIFTTILGIYIVKEKVFPVQYFFFLLAFAGVVVIEGFDPRISPLYLGLGIVAALFAGLAYNFIRKINKNEHPLVIVFYFPLVTMPLTGIYSYFHWVQPEGWEWFRLLMVGVLTQFAQYFMTKSYQEEELSKVSSLRYISIIYALSFGYIFFDETFNLMTYVGMLLVLMGVILNVWYKRKKDLQAART